MKFSEKNSITRFFPSDRCGMILVYVKKKISPTVVVEVRSRLLTPPNDAQEGEEISKHSA